MLTDAGAVITGGGGDGELIFDTKASAGRIKLTREKTAEQRVQEALLRAQRNGGAGDDDEEGAEDEGEGGDSEDGLLGDDAEDGDGFTET